MLLSYTGSTEHTSKLVKYVAKLAVRILKYTYVKPFKNSVNATYLNMLNKPHKCIEKLSLIDHIDE